MGLKKLVPRVAREVVRVTEANRKNALAQQLFTLRARLGTANLPANTTDSIIQNIAGIGQEAQTTERNYKAEQAWMNDVNADPANLRRVAEAAWFDALPAARREQMRGVLASATPVERRRLITLEGQYRQNEFNRLADMDEQARQAEQDIANGGMSAHENTLVNTLLQDQRQGLQDQLRQLANNNPDRRAEMQAAIATMNDAERHAFTQMNEAQRWTFLNRITDITAADFAARQQEINGGLDQDEQDFVIRIGDQAQQMQESVRLGNMTPEERGDYKAAIAGLNDAEKNYIADLPEDQRVQVLGRLRGLTGQARDNELSLMSFEGMYNTSVDFTDMVRGLPEDQANQVVQWLGNIGVYQLAFINDLTATERQRILRIPDEVQRTRELERIINLAPGIRNAEKGPEGRTHAERVWTHNIRNVVSPYDALMERRRIEGLSEEDRADFQARLAQLNHNHEMIWIMGAGADQVEQRLNDLLAMDAAERTQLQNLPSPNVMVWYSSLPEDERATALVQLQNLNNAQRAAIDALTPAQIRYFTGLEAGERMQRLRDYFNMSAEMQLKDRLQKSVAEMPPQLRQDLHGKLNELYNFDNISIEARNAIVTNDEEWARLQQEFPDVDLTIYREYMQDRSRTERSILAAGENSFDSMTALIDAELASGRITDAEHDVMRLKMEIYKELQNPSESIMERILGPDNMDWLRSAGLNIRQYWPIILTALIVAGAVAGGGFVGGAFVDGTFSWALAGGSGAVATIVRLGPTYRDFQRAKTSKKLIQLAQAERRVTFEQLEEYENKMLGGMELYAQQIANGVNPGQLQDQDPELYNYLLGLGIIGQLGNVQPENIIKNLLQFGSDHAKQVQKLEAALDKRRKDIQSKKTKSGMLGVAGKGLNANVTVGGGGLQPSFI